jgi:5-methylcytosine-specific restriction enzyme subunit McrC
MNKQNSEKILNLFEYSNQEHFKGDLEAFESFLDDIWKNRHTHDFLYQDISDEDSFDTSIASKQKFITSLKGGNIKSRKYVGIIKYNNHTINLLPKIFYNSEKENLTEQEIQAIQANILWWLSYCRKIKFPKTISGLSSIKSNFFEILIYIFANYTRHVLNNCLYQAYSEVHNELGFMKGRLDIKSYIRENISKGRWHKLSCTYDSFEFDNLFNRIIKSVSNILWGTTENLENKQLLSEILFILDEVSDIQATYEDCSKVQLNPLYDDMHTVLDYCKLFLANSVAFSYKNQFKVFAFLLPMEYVFEDFLFGFIEKHLKNIPGIQKLKSQKSDLYLARLYENENLIKDKVFNLKHDIYFEYHGKKIIADAKYKITYGSGKNHKDETYKHGVSQNDLYQVASYGIRRNATDIFLIYPKILSVQSEERESKKVKFSVYDELAEKDINIYIVKVPIIHHNFPDIDHKINLQKNFIETERKLIDKLNDELNIMDSI